MIDQVLEIVVLQIGKPWNQLENKTHSIACTTSVIMDSHLFDYNEFNKIERNDILDFGNGV